MHRTAVLCLVVSQLALAQSPAPAPEALVRNSTFVFQRATDTPSAAIPASIMLRARAILIVPGATYAGAVHDGSGVISSRAADGKWSWPLQIAFTGRTPIAFETDSVDFVVIALTARGANYLLEEHATFPSPGVWAPGPLGQDTLTKMNADIVSYVQFDRYFAGITVSDWSISRVGAINQESMAAREWRRALAAYFKEMS